MFRSDFVSVHQSFDSSYHTAGSLQCLSVALCNRASVYAFSVNESVYRSSTMSEIRRKKCKKLNFVCWNMRTLVEDEGSLETARARQDERVRKGAVEKKAVLMVWEMKRYATFVAAISESQWFGKNVL